MSSNIKDFWTSVIVFQDLVAIDNIGVNFLLNEPTVTYLNGALRGNPTVENYLREAKLAGDVLSGTMYADSQGNIFVTWVAMNIGSISKENSVAQPEVWQK